MLFWIWRGWLLIHILWLVIGLVHSWRIPEKYISKGRNGKNALPKSRQVFPIGHVEGGIVTDLIITKLVIETEMIFLEKKPSILIEYKVKWYNMSWYLLRLIPRELCVLHLGNDFPYASYFHRWYTGRKTELKYCMFGSTA